MSIFYFFLLSLCFFLMDVKKISRMLESFYTVLWEYIVADMQIEASKLQVLKDSLRCVSWKCFTWVIIVLITAFHNPLVVLLLRSRNYIWIPIVWMDQSTSKVKLSLINLQMKIRRVFHAYWERNIFFISLLYQSLRFIQLNFTFFFSLVLLNVYLWNCSSLKKN